MAAGYHPSDYLYARYLDISGLKPGSSKGSRKRYDVALFGLGRAGSIHVANLLAIPRYRLRYIVESSADRLQQIKDSYYLDDSIALLSSADAQTVFKDESVSAVVIATPSGDHEEYVSAALKAGKHVFCEKPIALTLDSVKTCYQLAQQCNRVLLCAFNRRYDPGVASVAESVRSGAVGTVHAISTVSRDSPKPSMHFLKHSGGIIHDCIVHDVDLVCWVLGEFPVKVLATAHAFDPEIAAIGDHDTVSVVMKFPSGVLGNISISREAKFGYDQRVEVLGNKGMVQSENQRPDAVVKSTQDGTSVAPILQSFPSRYGEAYIRQLHHFLALIDGITENDITGESVIKVCKILCALEHSLKTEAFVTVEY